MAQKKTAWVGEDPMAKRNEVIAQGDVDRAQRVIAAGNQAVVNEVSSREAVLATIDAYASRFDYYARFQAHYGGNLAAATDASREFCTESSIKVACDLWNAKSHPDATREIAEIVAEYNQLVDESRARFILESTMAARTLSEKLKTLREKI
jgi:hypothetical protein